MWKHDRCKTRIELRRCGALPKNDEKPNICGTCPGNKTHEECFVVIEVSLMEQKSKSNDWNSDDESYAF